MKKALLLASLLVFGASVLSAQTKVIKGTVTSAAEGNGPVSGVVVQVKGTTIATLTEGNGKYVLTVPRDATILVFSFTGMKKQEVAIAGRSVIDIIMEADVLTLQEVIVEGGYGIKRAPRSTSTLNQVIPGDKLNETRQTNVNYALAGKVPGIQVLGQSDVKLDYGSTSNARLRGNAGFSTGVSVIYVVDGTVIQDPNNIDVEDIDNVSVLSGPAAAAILGSQGSNGAIIVTTKKAKTSGGKAMGVEVNSGFQLSPVYLLPAYQNDYAGGNVHDMIKYTYKGTDPIEWKPLDGKYYHNYSDDASWGPRMAGQEYIPWYAWYPGTKYTGKTARLVPQPGNVRDFFDIGMKYNNNVAFNTIGDRYNIRAVIGNIAIKGNIPNTSMNKTTFTLKTSYNITQKLTFEANVNFFTTSHSGFTYADGYANPGTGMMNSWFHRDIDMNILRELQNLRTPMGTLAAWNHNDPPSYTPANPLLFYGANYHFSPFTYYNYYKRYYRTDRLFGNLSLNYKIMDGLDFKLTYRRQGTNAWGERKNYCDLYEGKANPPAESGYYYTGTSYAIRENFETLLSFKKKIGTISVNANAGTDFFSSLAKSNSAYTNGLIIRNLFSIANSKNQPSDTNNRSAEKYRAVFLRGDIGFRNLVFGEFTLRNDWFSALPPGNNSILSKSFGASLIFSDLLKLHWLSFGKLRASWGEIPTAIGTYVYPGFMYTVGQYQWNGNFMMTTPDQVVDPKIRGDVKTQKEIGIEAQFLNNRLGFTFTYWDGTEKDIPYAVTIAGYSGFSSKYLNTGKIAKQGVDITLNLRPLNMTNLAWDVNATFSKLIKNEVVRIAPGIDRFVVEDIWGGGSPAMVHAVGKPWGELFGSGMKMYNGKPLLNQDGSYIVDPQKYFGNILPEFTGGIQNSFTLLKRISIAANIDYQIGGKYFSLTDMWGSFSGLTARTSGLNDKGVPIRDPVADGGGVHVKGVDATNHANVDYYVDALTYFHNLYTHVIMDSFVHDLTYVKLRELSIGYTIPIERITHLKKYIQDARISLVAQNLWLIYARNYDLDPSEVSYVSGEQGQFPGTRSIGANIKINF